MHAAFNALDFDAVYEVFAADFYSHPLGARGPAAVRDRWAAMHAGAPDLRTEVLDVIAEGDRVAIRSRLSDGSAELFEVLRINNGQIAELWGARTS